MKETHPVRRNGIGVLGHAPAKERAHGVEIGGSRATQTATGQPAQRMGGIKRSNGRLHTHKSSVRDVIRIGTSVF